MAVEYPAINGTFLLPPLQGLGIVTKEYKSCRERGELCGMLISGHGMAVALLNSEQLWSPTQNLYNIGSVSILS